MGRRPVNAFALSFLDCICCGFGAVILVFMIISAKIQESSDEKLDGLEANRIRLESLAMASEGVLARLRAELVEIAGARESAREQKHRLSDEIIATIGEKAVYQSAQAEMEAQKKRIADLERIKASAADVPDESGSQIRTLTAEGDRQYLTGLRMGGKHILILVDTSASMLASTIVNVVRLRYLPDEEKLRAKKWKQVVGTVDWLTANIPGDSQFQMYTFDTAATPVLSEKGPGWIDVGDGSVLDEAVGRLRNTVPDNGTSLHAAFAVAATMNPRPDNIYLLVDGLPTHGASPHTKKMVSGKKRLKFFNRAIRNLPRGVPVNVILFAMEGDAYAPDSYWKLARNTEGAFISPALDWP
jgi:hypothetical protein